jgi:urea transporter
VLDLIHFRIGPIESIGHVLTYKIDQASLYGAYRLVTAVAVSIAIAAFNATIPVVLSQRVRSGLQGYPDNDVAQVRSMFARNRNSTIWQLIHAAHQTLHPQP